MLLACRVVCVDVAAPRLRSALARNVFGDDIDSDDDEQYTRRGRRVRFACRVEERDDVGWHGDGERGDVRRGAGKRDECQSDTHDDDTQVGGHVQTGRAGLVNYAYRYPALEVRESEHSRDAELGVFVRQGWTLQPWDAVPLIGRPVTAEQWAERVADGDARYVVAVPGGAVDGHPAIRPHEGVGMRGAAIWALVCEPATTDMANCTFAGGFFVVGQRLSAGDELLASYER
jgi:hypothetical protein